MRVLQTAISILGYSDVRGNNARLDILDVLLNKAMTENCDLLVLPAGYLRARNSGHKNILLSAIATRAQAAKTVAVIGGIDTVYPAKRDLERQARPGRALPFWGFAILPGQAPRSWQQQSSTGSNATLSNAVSLPARAVPIAGAQVLPLTCGEMYNHSMRASVQPGAFRLLADSAHYNIRRQLSRTMHNLWRQAQCAVLLSQHVGGKNGHLHFVDAKGNSQSEAILPKILPNTPIGAPWASAVARDI